MRLLHRKVRGLICFFGLGMTLFYFVWSQTGKSGVNSLPRHGKEFISHFISQHKTALGNGSGIRVNEGVARKVALNVCSCTADKETLQIPFSNWLFPRVWAHNLGHAFLESHPDPEGVKVQRAQEYSSFRKRSDTAADELQVAEANSPLQYPTQGLEVRPLNTVIIPGLALKANTASTYTVYLTAALGTFDVATIVDDVSLKGEGGNHMSLSSGSLSALNLQLMFVTYTNTVFHPRTAETVEFGTGDHRSFFTIKIGHKSTPKLYNTRNQGEYNISALVTIATKTFLRYDKLKELIDSIRQYYPTVTIVIADDNQHPQPVTGPHIEQYFMPFGKGWFAGRNLAVSQVTTKYVLWVDDDFYFTSNTKLEKMVDILEKTTLDLAKPNLWKFISINTNDNYNKAGFDSTGGGGNTPVAGAVREATGYTATFRHIISVEDGGEEGDCLHVRNGYYHDIQGFPNCVVADAVINFFMGRTDKIREVGFNPRLARYGHLEFFIDGLGSLHIGSCSDIIVNHASKIHLPWGKTQSEKEYAKFRYSSNTDETNLHNEIFYFTNRFKCMTSH